MGPDVDSPDHQVSRTFASQTGGKPLKKRKQGNNQQSFISLASKTSDVVASLATIRPSQLSGNRRVLCDVAFVCVRVPSSRATHLQKHSARTRWQQGPTLHREGTSRPDCCAVSRQSKVSSYKSQSILDVLHCAVPILNTAF